MSLATAQERIQFDARLRKFLPDQAVKKLRALMQRADDLRQAHLAIRDQTSELHTMAGLAKDEIAKADRAGFHLMPEDSGKKFKSPVDIAKEHLAQVVEELENSKLAYAERAGAFTSAMTLANGLQDWSTSLRGPLPAFSGVVEAKIIKGETPQDAIERRRRRLRELVAELDSTKAAPIPSADAKKAAREQVAALAERGRPGVSDVLQFKGGAIVWPEHSRRETILGASENLLSTSTHPDGLALLAHVMPDLLIAALDREIDRMADDVEALDDVARAKKLQTILDDQLAVQREEESLIEKLETSGIFVARRPDADPRAVLGLAAAGREQRTSEVAA
jgi:hypothetical protein